MCLYYVLYNSKSCLHAVTSSKRNVLGFYDTALIFLNKRQVVSWTQKKVEHFFTRHYDMLKKI